MGTEKLDKKFLQVARKGDAVTMKMYLEPKYQIAQLYEWPLNIRLKAFVCTPSVEICEMLLNAGLTDINECVCWSEDTEKGYFVTSETALTNAIREDNLPKVQWLVSRSVNVNKLLVYSAVDKGIQYKDETDTPLMHAVRKESTEIVKLLLAAGADVNFKNSFGQNVLQVATKKGLTEIVTLLKSAGAKE